MMFDENNNKCIDKIEFTNLMKTVNNKFNKSMVDEIFDIFDVDKNEKISFDSFKIILS